MAYRVDARGSVRKVTPTPQGGLLIEAAVRREGILEYPRADGTVQREYVPASELGNGTLRNAPVTNRHPPGAVTPKNFKTYAVGHVDGEGQAEGDHWVANLVIQADDALGAVETRTAREVSCGYTCDLDETPGVWQGQKYDAVQRNVKFNHVAIVPQGRAGSSVRLRMDSNGDTLVEITPFEESNVTPEQIAKLQIDLAKSQADLLAATSRADTAETSAKAEKARADTAEGENKVNKARADAAEKLEQERKDAAELAQVSAVAAKCVKGFKADGKTVAQVKAEVVAAKFPALKLDAAHLDGAYVAAVSAPDAGAALRETVRAVTKTDDAPVPDARARMLARHAAATKTASGVRLDAAGNVQVNK